MITSKDFNRFIDLVRASDNKDDIFWAEMIKDVIDYSYFDSELSFFNSETNLNVKKSDILGAKITTKEEVTKKLVISYIFTKDTFYTYYDEDVENTFVCKYDDIHKVERLSNDTNRIIITMKDGKEYSRCVFQGAVVALLLGEIIKLNGDGAVEVKVEAPKKEKKSTKKPETKEKVPAKKKTKAAEPEIIKAPVKELERSSKNRVEEIDDMIDWSKALFKYRSLNDESKIKIFAKVRDTFGPFFDNTWVISGFDKLKPDEKINDANKYIERNRVLAYIDVVMDAYINEEMILDGQEIALEFGIKEPVKMSEEEIRAHDRVNGRKQFVNYTKHRIHRLDDLYKPHNGNNSIYSKRSKSILGGSARSHAVSVIDGHKGYGVIDYKNASKASKDDMINVATNEIGITFFKEDQIPDTYVLKDVFKDTEYGFLTGPCNVSGVDLRYLFAFETIEEFLEFYYDVRTKNPSCRILAAGIEGKEIDFAQLKLMGE
ncbi:MAG: hypothetical protein MJ126_07740 [Lachnospiraceae bacterium]|nr:hypothetical protein [Lachnospiraceae bacterium]